MLELCCDSFRPCTPYWSSNLRKTLAEFSKPFDNIRGKKYKNHSFSIWSSMWPSKFFFFGLFHFFWDILCLRSPPGCSYPIYKFNIIPNGKWFKFSISNHSDNADWLCLSSTAFYMSCQCGCMLGMVDILCWHYATCRACPEVRSRPPRIARTEWLDKSL